MGVGGEFCALIVYLFSLNRGGRGLSIVVLCLFSNYCLSSFFLLTNSACMPRRFLSERESERGGGLIDSFVNPERDVGLEVMLICEAFFRMEPCVDSLWWIFTGRALSEGRLLTIVPVEGSVPIVAQVG